MKRKKSYAGKNEKLFEAAFPFKAELKGKLVFKSDKYDVQISVDNHLVIPEKNMTVLFEIDSANAAKLIVGQYVLLNQLLHNKDNHLLVVLHYYKNYNIERTVNNLNLVNEQIYQGKGLKFKVYLPEEFMQLVKETDYLDTLTK